MRAGPPSLTVTNPNRWIQGVNVTSIQLPWWRQTSLLPFIQTAVTIRRVGVSEKGRDERERTDRRSKFSNDAAFGTVSRRRPVLGGMQTRATSHLHRSLSFTVFAHFLKCYMEERSKNDCNYWDMNCLPGRRCFHVEINETGNYHVLTTDTEKWRTRQAPTNPSGSC
jgi:hypothetical protein